MRWIAMFLLGCSAPAALATTDTGAPAFALHYSNSLGVAPGAEGTHCLDAASPPVDTWVSGWRVHKQGVHHVNLWRRTSGAPRWPVVSPCSGAWGRETAFLLDSSKPELEQMLPSGVGMFLPASTPLIFDVHFLNASVDASPETVDIEFMLAGSHDREASGLLWMQSGELDLAPGQMKTVMFSPSPATEAVEIVSLMGHTHIRGTLQTVSVDGAEVYRSTNWADPPVSAALIPVGPSSRISWSCTYENPGASMIQWGTTLQTSEMCMVWGLIVGPTWESQ